MRRHAAGIAIGLGLVALAAAGEGPGAGRTKFQVEHVRAAVGGSFQQTREALERQLGRFDPTVTRGLADGADPAGVRDKLEAMAGTSGFMIFGVNDHGSLLRLVGKPRKAVQYVIGNPLLAIEMTRYATGAALYAPLRLLLVEDEGKTYVEYDRPSSFFGQFHDANVDGIAALLDRKMEALVDNMKAE